MVLTLGVLALAAVALGRAPFDRASLEPFFDPSRGGFPLRRDWFFENTLHLGGRWVAAAAALTLLAAALLPKLPAGWSAHRGRFLYLATCFLVTAVLVGVWRVPAQQSAPWHTLGFGGSEAWPGSQPGASLWVVLGSPGAHAAAGFAWLALYFVGASLGKRPRWLWLLPGSLLGVLFALGQHVRGAHPPSSALWALATAWAVAAGVAWAFRRRGWLAWDETVPPAPAEPRPLDDAAPWLVAISVGCCGVAFFALDMLVGQFEGTNAGLHLAYEYVEFGVMALGSAVVAWLLTDKFRTMRARASRTLDEEREKRFQVLGRLAAAVAHEVRNPLQSLRLIVDEQRHDVPGLRDHPLQPEFESSIDRIDRAVDLVYRLARPESGGVECADLAQVARESIVALTRLERDRVKFAWVREPPPAVVASSRSGLRIVLDNLLRNALQATPPAGTVRLELEPHAASWQLRIRNPGSLRASKQGVPHPDTPAGEKGLGLGVPISRQLALNAGGSIDFEEAGGIVTCTLRWPREAGGAA